jgi:hypothetical protein
MGVGLGSGIAVGVAVDVGIGVAVVVGSGDGITVDIRVSVAVGIETETASIDTGLSKMIYDGITIIASPVIMQIISSALILIFSHVLLPFIAVSEPAENSGYRHQYHHNYSHEPV